MQPADTKSVLRHLGIPQLNPMQEEVRKAFALHQALACIAPTGSGKTLAFLLCVLDHLQEVAPGQQVLILAPTRELVMQLASVFRSMKTGFSTCLCYGGHDMDREIHQLRAHPACIMATPGRFNDHLRNGRLETQCISLLILDEYDRCLELGFYEEMKTIFLALLALHKLLLTSATSQENWPDFISWTDKPVLDFSPHVSSGKTDKFSWQTNDKQEALLQFLLSSGQTRTIVFFNQREEVERCAARLSSHDLPLVVYHGGMEQPAREEALCLFRNGSRTMLFATDLAARGLDIPEVSFIVHMQLPDTEATDLHRNGRTARMQQQGAVLYLLGSHEYLPPFIQDPVAPYNCPSSRQKPEKPLWSTLHFYAGKKDKISKGDIAGFLIQTGQLKKEWIGLIEVWDRDAYAAVLRTHIREALREIAGKKIKKQSVRVFLLP